MKKFTCNICGKSVNADHSCIDKILTGYQPTEQDEILELPNGGSDVIPPMADPNNHITEKSLIKGIKILVEYIVKKEQEIQKLRAAIKKVLAIDECGNHYMDCPTYKILKEALDEIV